MDKSIRKILETIEDNGFEAYIVGGYVRDYLLNKDTKDIDICTNARVIELMDIFKDYNITSNNYGAVKFTFNDFKIEITTYREEIKYNGDRRDLEIRYVDNLVEDIKRRDFTINSICMNKEGYIIDILNGEEDIKNKIIRCVGDIDKKLEDDPLRILRAIRFASILDFKIDEELYNKIKEKRELVSKLSTTRILEELTKILINSNYKKGLDYIKRLKLNKYLGIDYNDIIEVHDICGMYSQIEFNKDYNFTKEEKNNIEKIKEIVHIGTIDKKIVFEYGLYLAIVAGTIIGIDKKTITKIEKSLTIKCKSDINITGTEICQILCIKPSRLVGKIYQELEGLLLDNKLENNNEEIKKYLIDNRKKWQKNEYKTIETN